MGEAGGSQPTEVRMKQAVCEAAQVRHKPWAVKGTRNNIPKMTT